MRHRVFWLSLVLAAISISVIGLLSPPRIAQAVTGDICQLIAWDSTGTVLGNGSTVGGDGKFYILARQEDDPFGFFADFVKDGPGADVLDETLGALQDDIAANEAEIAELEDLLEQDEIDDTVLTDQEEAEAEATIAALEAEIAALEEIIREIEEIIEGFIDYDLVTVDSQTGSARIRSYAEVAGFDFITPSVYHKLIPAPGVGSQKIDHMFPNFFNGPDGEELNSISEWLEEVGVPLPVGISKANLDADNVCGGPSEDGWKFVDLVCFEPGSFHVTVTPNVVNGTTENTGKTIALKCPGQVETAQIKASHNMLETQPVGNNSSSAVITVTAYDQFGNNFDGAEVTFIANTCTFSNPLAGAAADAGHQPAGGGPTLTTWTDTDSQADANFLDDNPMQKHAGTAEVMLECKDGTPGTVTVTAQVEREGADIILEHKITLVGPTAALALVLTPAKLVCGETLIAEAGAVDVNNHPVSDGTRIYFTTDTSSAIINGKEGAQGSNTTIGGKTMASIAMSPDDPGTHTVIAYVLDKNGAVLQQVAALVECTSQVSAAPPAPTTPPVTAPSTGTGRIVPPSTGDAGLAETTASGASAYLAGAALAAAAGAAIVTVRKARRDGR